MQLRERAAHAGRGARFPKSVPLFGRMRTFVEISIRHNGFHVDSFRFASSRYIRFALPKNRLTGSNPMRERADILPRRPLFLRQFFPGAHQSPRGGKISRGKSGEREPIRTVRVRLRQSIARTSDVPRSGKSSSRLDSFAYHRFPILTIKFYIVFHIVFIYTFQE